MTKPLRTIRLLPFAIISGVSVAVYFNSLFNGFVYDDAQNQLGVVYAEQRLIAMAIEHFKIAAQLRPESRVFRDNLENALTVQR